MFKIVFKSLLIRSIKSIKSFVERGGNKSINSRVLKLIDSISTLIETEILNKKKRVEQSLNIFYWYEKVFYLKLENFSHAPPPKKKP